MLGAQKSAIRWMGRTAEENRSLSGGLRDSFEEYGHLGSTRCLSNLSCARARSRFLLPSRCRSAPRLPVVAPIRARVPAARTQQVANPPRVAARSAWQAHPPVVAARPAWQAHRRVAAQPVGVRAEAAEGRAAALVPAPMADAAPAAQVERWSRAAPVPPTVRWGKCMLVTTIARSALATTPASLPIHRARRSIPLRSTRRPPTVPRVKPRSTAWTRSRRISCRTKSPAPMARRQ